MWKLFVYGKIFARGKTKSGRKSLVKKDKNKNKQKQKQAKRRKKEYHSVKKRKKSFVKATGTGGALRWRPDFEQRSRLLTKICHT